MANQILAGAVFQAGQVIAGIDADTILDTFIAPPTSGGASKVVVGAYNDDIMGSVYVYDANDLTAQPTKLTAFDGATSDYFGRNISINSEQIVVAAYGDDDNGSKSGSVYVYDANDLSTQPTKLTAFDAAETDQFGHTVFATDDNIFVGANYDDDMGYNSGSVYVYDANDLSTQPTKLTAFDGSGSDQFGSGNTVFATDDKIVVGAFYDDDMGYNSGSVYVFNANDLTAQPTKLTAFDGSGEGGGDKFGWSVAATADKIVVGARDDDDNGSNSGSVYVYDANDLSATPTKLTPFDGSGSDNFGGAVAATDDNIFVGATYDDDNGSNSGSVYVYDANDLSATPTKLTPFDAAAGDQFGNAVSAIADKIVVGAFKDDDNGGQSGSVYVYDANDLSAQPTKLTAFDGAYNDYFGFSVAVGTATTTALPTFIAPPAPTARPTARYYLVNATQDDDNGSMSGSVYVYDANDLSAIPTKLTPFDGVANDKFGISMGANDDKIVIASRSDGGNGTNSGSVYVYDANDLSVTPTKLTAFDGAESDFFGNAMGVSNDKIVVGATHDDDNGSMSGSIYVYDANDLSATPTKLTAFDAAESDFFSYSIGVSNDKIVVGALWDDDNGTNSGSVYVYDANDLSAQPTKLTAFDGAENDWFARAVSITDNKIVVGAVWDDDNGSNSGSVYVYDANDLSATPTKLTPFDGVANDYFGWSVFVSDDKIVVGDTRSSGSSVYVYDANDLSVTPTKLSVTDSGDSIDFGRGLSIVGDKMLVGAPYDNDNGTNSGSVYIYDANDLSATPTKLTAFDGVADDHFGNTVGIVPTS